MSDIPIASGVYKITCTVTKKIYIGSTVNLRKRKKEHFGDLQQNKHKNRYLQRAWNKYGEQSFTFEALELVLPMSLTAREQYWFNKLKPFGRKGFNIARDAEAIMFGRKHTSETIEKLKGRKNSPETLEKWKQSALGKKHTPKARERMSQARIGRKKSPEHIEKISNAQKGRTISEETRHKLSESHKGYTASEETKQKMSEASKMRPISEETRRKMNASHKGYIPSEEHRRKLSEIGKKREAIKKGHDHEQ